MDFHVADTPGASVTALPASESRHFQPPVRSRLPYLCTVDADTDVLALQQTCIVATIGPASNTAATLAELLAAGMAVASLDFSQFTIDEQTVTLRTLRAAQRARVASAAAAGRTAMPLAIALDTKGPEIRTGLMNARLALTVQLVAGQQFRLTIVREYAEKGTSKINYVDYENLVKVVRPGDRMFLDDGLIALRADVVGADTITTTVVIGGTLAGYKTVSLCTGTPADLPTIGDKDRAALRFAVENDLDAIFVSGVRSAGDIAEVRKQLGERGRHIAVLAKLQTRQALGALEAIVRAADGVLFWRCDLTMQLMSAGQVCLAQKKVLAVCKVEGKLALCGTQFLAQPFANAERPRRVDQWDIGSAICDGADGIVLTGATAVRANAVQCVQIAHRTCLYAEAALCQVEVLADVEPRWRVDTVQAILFAAVRMAWRLRVRCVVVVSATGATAMAVSMMRPGAVVVTVVRSARVARRCRFYWGVWPVVFVGGVEWGTLEGDEERATFGLAFARELGAAAVGDRVVVLSDVRNGPQCAARVVVVE